MNKRAEKLFNDETPFAVIDIAGKSIRQYWTRSKSCPQVCTIIFRLDGAPSYITSGWGYDKSSDGLEWAFAKIGKQPKDWAPGHGVGKYAVGGNYHFVPKSNTRQYGYKEQAR